MDLAELQRRLEHVATDARIAAERKALRKVGKVIKDAVVERAPVRPDVPAGNALPSGALAADIHARVHIRDGDGVSDVVIAPGKKTQHVALWLERGHALVRGKKSRSGKGQRTIGTVAAKPFLRPAAESSKDQAVETFVSSMSADLAQAFETGSTPE